MSLDETIRDLDRWGAELRAVAERQAFDPQEPRRRAALNRARRRRRLLAVAASVLAVATVGLVVATRGPDDDSVGVEVVSSTTAPPLPGDPPVLEPLASPIPGVITREPKGPYRAGDQVTFTMPATSTGDYLNDRPRICFAWGAGETCDASIWENGPVGTEVGETISWTRSLPGWVTTPAGVQPCSKVRCRIVFSDELGRRVGTAVLDIDPGAKPPAPLIRIERIEDDGRIVVAHDGLTPDTSWTAWAVGRSQVEIDGFRPYGLSLCAYSWARWQCDALHDLPALRWDGSSQELTLPSARLLFTPHGADGWVDCAEVACVVSLSRAIGVGSMPDGATLGSDEIAAWVPYRLSKDVPAAPRPSMELAPGPYVQGGLIEFTIRNLPASVDLDIGLGPSYVPVGQCVSEDLTVKEDCSYSRVAGLETRTEPDTGLITMTASVPALPCWEPRGCYLAFTGAGGKGYPALVKSERFPVAGP